MHRYNLFHKIHKGLQALLYDTSMLLQRIDFTIDEEAADGIGRVQFVLSLFDRFQESEDAFILPVMMTYEPGVADAFEQDHEEAYLLSEKITTQVNHFRKASLPLEKLTFSNEIVTLFEEYTLFNILHMAREEQLANQLLWRYYTDAELKRIAWKIVSTTGSEALQPYSKWMIRGLNNNEIVGWLKEVKCTAPEMEFRSLLKTAEDELQPGRWNVLQDVLTSGTFLAN